MRSFLLEDIELELLPEVESCIEKRQPFEIVAVGPRARELWKELNLKPGKTSAINQSTLKASTAFFVFGLTAIGLLSHAVAKGFTITAAAVSDNSDAVKIKCNPS